MNEPIAYMAENGLVNPFKTEQYNIPLYTLPEASGLLAQYEAQYHDEMKKIADMLDAALREKHD